MKKLIYSQEDLDLILSLEIQKYEDKTNNLQFKIDKAIEYIEKNNFFDHEITVEMNGEYNCGDDFKSELLDILKEND